MSTAVSVDVISQHLKTIGDNELTSVTGPTDVFVNIIQPECMIEPFILGEKIKYKWI